MSNFDEKLKTQILERFKSDSRIDIDTINVEASNGTVLLSGNVRSLAAFEAAENKAWSISGVTVVNNRLHILYPESFQKPSEDLVKSTLSQLFSWEPDLFLEPITISVQNSNILLEGTVNSFFKKKRAGDLARTTTSTFTIRNNIIVVPASKKSDIEIAKSIINSIDRNTITDVNDMAVEVNDGHVLLRGKVSNQVAFDTVEDIVHFTEGVVDLENQLVISKR